MNHLRPDALQEYLDRFKREVFPKLASCKMSITIYSGKFDAKLAIELGAAILLEKPIILVVADGVKIPGRLQAVADSIVIGNPMDPAVSALLQKAITTVLTAEQANRAPGLHQKRQEPKAPPDREK